MVACHSLIHKFTSAFYTQRICSRNYLSFPVKNPSKLGHSLNGGRARQRLVCDVKDMKGGRSNVSHMCYKQTLSTTNVVDDTACLSASALS